MDELALQVLLDDVASGRCAPDDAVMALKRLPFADLGFAKIDHHRSVRQNMGEVIYGPGKSPDQCAKIAEELLSKGSGPVLLTRANPAQIQAATWAAKDCGFEDGVVTPTGAHALVSWRHRGHRPGRLLIVTAGTSDIPVGNECKATLCAFGFSPTMLFDCGVAGIHRLFASLEDLGSADGIVVVAGMEGALASVVGGVVGVPVVAVPTSTGYGAAFEGVTALLAMLSSCAAGIVVVGIDNGFGAGCALARMMP